MYCIVCVTFSVSTHNDFEFAQRKVNTFFLIYHGSFSIISVPRSGVKTFSVPKGKEASKCEASGLANC